MKREGNFKSQRSYHSINKGCQGLPGKSDVPSDYQHKTTSICGPCYNSVMGRNCSELRDDRLCPECGPCHQGICCIKI